MRSEVKIKKVKDDDIIISCDKKYTCYEHLHANECLRAYRKECKVSDKYKQALKEIEKLSENAYCLTNGTNKDMAEFAKTIMIKVNEVLK